MEKERDLISELCKKWGLAYGEAEIKQAIEHTVRKNGNKTNGQPVFENQRNIEWNARDGGILSLTGLRGR